ncbi:MAG: hypothetical protein U0798_20080 [Gemmataceae bacterium]
MNSFSRFLQAITLVFLVGSFMGCGDSGSNRLRFSGTVKVDGKPVPYGEVLITPDSTKKNSGPQGKASIKDGVFDTKGVMGVGSGPMIVRVNGMSGPNGKTICEYQFEINLPTKDSEKDIVIPAKEAFNANPQFNPNAKEI